MRRLEFGVSQNRPNPFSAPTTVRLTLPWRGEHRLDILSVSRRLVRSFTGFGEPGEVMITWDGTGDAGAAAAPGMYFYRAQAAGQVEVRRMLLLR